MLSEVRDRKRFAWLCLLSALVLSAGPGASLYAASPCHAGKPMTCCAGEESGDPSPCGCSLSPPTPAPAAVDVASPVTPPAEEPAPLLETAPDSPLAAPAASVSPRARAGPLFLLDASLRN